MNLNAIEKAFGLRIPDARAQLGKLTPRQRELAERLADGLDYKQAAVAMGSSLKTVYSQGATIYGKMQIHSVVTLVKIVLLVRLAKGVMA
jgi:DNA-binding NarL/FixJ family response regulator